MAALIIGSGCAAPFPPTPTVADSFVMYSNGRQSATTSARGANGDWFGVNTFLPFNPVVVVRTASQ
jgi:hypothetical protein